MCILQGGYKLKIPSMLLSEKERTRSRFFRRDEAKALLNCSSSSSASSLTNSPLLPMKKGKKNNSEKVSASSPVLSQKICKAVQEDILCLAEDAERGVLPSFTPFSTTEDDNMQHVVQIMKKECPVLTSVENREKLVFTILNILDESEK